MIHFHTIVGHYSAEELLFGRGHILCENMKEFVKGGALIVPKNRKLETRKVICLILNEK